MFLKHQETRSIDSPPPTPSPPLDKMLGYSPIFCQITQLFFSWVNKGNGGSKSILSSKENTENPINSVAVPVSNTPFPRCLLPLCQNESESSYKNDGSSAYRVIFYANQTYFHKKGFAQRGNSEMVYPHVCRISKRLFSSPETALLLVSTNDVGYKFMSYIHEMEKPHKNSNTIYGTTRHSESLDVTLHH